MFVNIDQILQNFKLGYANAIKPVYRAILNYTLRIPSHHENFGPSHGSDRQSPGFYQVRRVNVRPSFVGFLVDIVALG